MPAGLVADPAPLVERGQNVLDGDVEVLAGTRRARIKGLTASLLSAMPPGTFLANLYDTAEPGRPFDAATIAGDGMTYDLDIENGPFAELVGEDEQSFPTSVTVVDVVLPIAPVAKDRVIIGTQHNGANTVTTPSGYTLKSHVALADSDVNIYERILDGTEGTTVSITASVAGAVLVKVWVVRYANESITCEVVSQSQTSTGGTSNDLGTITPSWGIANQLFLTFIGIEADATAPNITAFPTSFVGTGELQNVSGTASLDGAIGWGSLASRVTSLDPSAYTYGPARSAAFVIAIPPRESGRFNVTPGGGSAGWDDVLLTDKHSGATSPTVDTGQFIQFGTADTSVPTGQIRSDNTLLIRGGADVDVTAQDSIHITSGASQIYDSGDSVSMSADQSITFIATNNEITATAGSFMTLTSVGNMTLTPSGQLILGSTSLTDEALLRAAGIVTISSAADIVAVAGSTGVDITATTGTIALQAPVVGITTGFLRFQEVVASTPSMAAGQGLFWVKNDAPNNPYFTDDTNVDRQIATYPLLLSGFPTIADDTFLANISGGTAVPSAVALSTLAGAGLTGGADAILNVTAGAGASLVVSANDIQRGALTGAITAAQDSNATAFGALAAKSVLANATNASAVPAALAGSAAFQHLRVNSANTGLEWSVFTTGDFPSNSVPLTALATQATDTFVGNITAGTATPIAVAFTSIDSTSIIWDATAHELQRAALTGDVTATQNSNATTIANNAVTNAKLADMASPRLKGRTTAASGDPEDLTLVDSTSITWNTATGGSISVERAALTGAVTASANNNTTAFGALAAKSVLANATNASAVPAALAGSAAFQHLRVNSANTGLEWSVFTTGDFPSNSVPITALATIATDTLLANITAGTATPVAVAFTSIDSTSIIWDATAHELQRAAFTGDVTASQNSNALTIAADAVSNAKMANMTALSVKANATNASDNPTDVASSADDTVFRRTATTLNWGQLTVGMAPNDVWTYAKIQNVSATSRFLGRITAGAGDIEELTGTQATTLLDNFTSTLKGLAPLSGGGTTNFLRADGTWAAPVAAGDGLGPDGDKGDITVGGTGTTLTIDNNAVTLAKMATVATARLLGRTTAATGNVEALTLTNSTSITWNVATGGTISLERAALTGEVTASANNNATTVVRSTDFGTSAWTGNHEFDANVQLNSTFEVRQRLDATLAADADDVDMTTRNVYRAVGNGFSLLGMIPFVGSGGTANGQTIQIFNADSGDELIIAHEAAATAARGFSCPDLRDFHLPPRSGVWARYDDTADRWFLLVPGNTSVQVDTSFSITPGAYTFTPPAAATWFEFWVTGAGGGGGGADAETDGEACAGGGGGAGCTIYGRFRIVTGDITGSVGTGGTAGANTGGTGGTGGNSTLVYNSVTETATGGAGGVGTAAGAGGALTNFLFTAGGLGGNGTVTLGEEFIGGGGTPGMMYGNAATETNAAAAGGTGGASFFGGGGTGGVVNAAAGTSNGQSTASGPPGAGGGGGARIVSATAAATGATGGAGAFGRVYVIYRTGLVPSGIS